MAKHLSVLRQFEVSSDRDDSGVSIAHHYQQCDWEGWADGYRITDLMKQATVHAKACDGKPRPRKPSQPSVLGSAVMNLWGPMIRYALESTPVFAGAVKPVSELPAVVHIGPFPS